MMQVAFLLSGKYPELNFYELKTLLEAYNVEYSIIKNYNNRLVIIDIYRNSEFFENISRRIVLTKGIYKFIAEADVNKNPLDIMKNLEWEKIVEPPYYVKSIRIPKRNKRLLGIANKVADLIWNSISNPSVDVKNPKTEIDVIIMGDKILVCKKLFEVMHDFKNRKPNLRPFFHPTALKPEDARLLVNLSKVREGELILDPFCGTGSILIEACLMDIYSIGLDIQDIMIEGCILNLKKFCSKNLYSLMKYDARFLGNLNMKVDAVVTDPPYGIGSKVVSNDIVELYNSFIEGSYSVLKKNCRLVMFVPNWLEKKIDLNGFEMKYKYRIKVHSGLTRILYVLEKV